jgi:RNA polymerase sigma-70 factor (ECF subfamily)
MACNFATKIWERSGLGHPTSDPFRREFRLDLPRREAQKARITCVSMPLSDLPNRVNEPAPIDDRTLSAGIAAELPRLRRHAYSLLYNRADAEDMVQDCVEAALAKRATLKDPERLRGWLFAILNNLFLTRMRTQARRGTALPIDDFADSLVASVPASDRDTARDLARAMGKLSVEHRQILLLINVEGQSYQEAADSLGVPIGTVMSRLARARQRLRALIEGRELQAVD